MVVDTLQFIALICTAIAMGGGFAHLLELPRKMELSREDYRTVQQIYRGWAFLGIAVMGALITTTALAFLARKSGSVFYLSLVAPLCIALSLVVFFAFTFPVNRATQDWSVLPEGWATLRRRWELSHATGAMLYLVALAALAISIAVSES